MPASPCDVAFSDCQLLLTGCRLLKGRLKLRFGCCLIDLAGRQRAIGKDRNHIACNLHKSSVDVKTLQLPFATNSQLAKAEPSNHRAMVAVDSQLAVKKRQNEKIGFRLQDRHFGSHDDTRQRALGD